MKPITQQILVGLCGCIGLILLFSVALSWMVNDALAKFERQGTEFLPTPEAAQPLEESPP